MNSNSNGTDKSIELRSGLEPVTFFTTQVWCRCFDRLSHILAFTFDVKSVKTTTKIINRVYWYQKLARLFTLNETVRACIMFTGNSRNAAMYLSHVWRRRFLVSYISNVYCYDLIEPAECVTFLESWFALELRKKELQHIPWHLVSLSI